MNGILMYTRITIIDEGCKILYRKSGMQDMDNRKVRKIGMVSRNLRNTKEVSSCSANRVRNDRCQMQN